MPDEEPAGWRERLFARRAQGVKLGLDAVRAVDEALGRPVEGVPVLHVLGTNGKGSTSAMAAHALKTRGMGVVGLYTSPHLERIGERVRIDGVPVADEAVRRAVRQVEGAEARIGEHLSFFEVLTLAGLLAFRDAGVNMAVIEAGLGGRLDATRVRTPACTVLTSVSMDHQHYLGTTLSAIADEKIAAAVPGVPCLVSPQADEVRERVEQRAAERALDLRWIPPADRAPRGLPGAHQRANAALACAAVEVLTGTPATLEQLDDVAWPGRGERCEVGKGAVVFDVAHNVGAVAALRELLPSADVLVFGAMGDKDVGAMIDVLPVASELWWVPPASEGAAASPEQGWRLFRDAGSSVGAILDVARGGATVLVCGSHYLVGAIRGPILNGGGVVRVDPGDPR